MNIIQKITSIGIVSGEDKKVKQQKEFLLYLCMIMGMGGVVWGAICLYFGLFIPATIPFGYVLFTLLNCFYFSKSYNFKVVRGMQMTMSILLPFLFQWSLGGFISSGAVMMWATLSLIASLSFQDTRSSIWWLALFLCLTIISAAFEPYVHEHFNVNLPVIWTGLLFALNISIAVAVVFLMVVYFINVRDQSNDALNEKHHALKKSQAQLIQSEKMAVLGQLIAGVAHEVNTPLGAIQASVGIIADANKYLIKEFPQLLEELNKDQKNFLFQLLEHSASSTNLYSAKEERQFKKNIIQLLEDNDIEDADSFADTLVDIGIYNNVEQYITMLKDPLADKILLAVYNIVEQQKNSQNIRIAVERASKVVYALKSYSHRTQHESKITANVVKGLETVLTLYHNQIKKGVNVNREFATVPDILCYPDELNQVWTNLIHNSIQAMDNNGSIDISVENDAGQQIKVMITDNGKGIPPEVLPRIFEPFFTTKPAGEGSGLGLDIVKQIVEKHNGKISVDSIPGKTTFEVTLPIMN